MQHILQLVINNNFIFSHTSFIQPIEPQNNNESYYKQILTEREDVILRETQCDNYHQSGKKIIENKNKMIHYKVLGHYLFPFPISDKQKRYRNTIPIVTVDPILPLNIQR